MIGCSTRAHVQDTVRHLVSASQCNKDYLDFSSIRHALSSSLITAASPLTEDYAPFANSSDIQKFWPTTPRNPYVMTNRGLEIKTIILCSNTILGLTWKLIHHHLLLVWHSRAQDGSIGFLVLILIISFDDQRQEN